MALFKDLAERMDIELVNGRGDFRGGSCVVEDQHYIVVNQTKPLESRLRVLAKEFNDIGLGDIYLVPALRDFIETVSSSNNSF